MEREKLAADEALLQMRLVLDQADDFTIALVRQFLGREHGRLFKKALASQLRQTETYQRALAWGQEKLNEIEDPGERFRLKRRLAGHSPARKVDLAASPYPLPGSGSHDDRPQEVDKQEGRGELELISEEGWGFGGLG